MNTELFIPLLPAKPTPTPAPDESESEEALTAKEALRDQTAYSNERTVVNWACGLTTVGAIFTFVVVLANGGGPEAELVFCILVGSLLSAWIGWGIAHAIYDMADCSLDRWDSDDDDS
jgi:hypothetical protein